MRYDIVVVGAGPAGASAGGEAAKLGAKVLIVERKRIIGEPIQCAEFIPGLLSTEVKFTERSVAQKVMSMRTHLFSEKCFEINSPGYILNRKVFDKELIESARTRGADVWTGAVCVSKIEQGVLIKRDSKYIEVSAKVIIGADGPKSTVGRWIGEVSRDFITALQYEMPLESPMDYTDVYFDPKIVGGYGWLFPKGETANVGVGVRRSEGLKQILERFIGKLKKEGKIRGNPVSTTGGLIPVGGVLNTVKDNVILVGDAAGQTHSITGGGIPQAIICGKIAGRVTAQAIKKDNLNILLEYKDKWHRIFGQELERAYIKRKFLDDFWNGTDTILKKCWVGFKEYYE